MQEMRVWLQRATALGTFDWTIKLGSGLDSRCLAAIVAASGAFSDTVPDLQSLLAIAYRAPQAISAL
jgi:hypothetical protein